LNAEPALVGRLALPGMAFADLADGGQDLPLPPVEAAHVARAGEKRRRDFAMGRSCGRLALDRLGAGAGAIAIGTRGAPLWPPGVSGSITHTQGYAAAVVARNTAFTAIGIDAEHVGDMSPALEGKLFQPGERAALDRLGADRARGAAILFSAKEAYYKACLGQAGALEFQSLCVTPGPEGFSVRDKAGGAAAGRFLVVDDLVLTLVAVAA
jgi:4'-phosphopantetheinyl transferase EntD